MPVLFDVELLAGAIGIFGKIWTLPSSGGACRLVNPTPRPTASAATKTKMRTAIRTYNRLRRDLRSLRVNAVSGSIISVAAELASFIASGRCRHVARAMEEKV